ncbi:hypothetical protein ACNKHL_03270 [Shigella flexneri]
MVAHDHLHPEIQQLAEETGGCISDSLEMCVLRAKHPASLLLIKGEIYGRHRATKSVRKKQF